jgi:endoglucanase
MRLRGSLCTRRSVIEGGTVSPVVFCACVLACSDAQSSGSARNTDGTWDPTGNGVPNVTTEMPSANPAMAGTPSTSGAGNCPAGASREMNPELCLNTGSNDTAANPPSMVPADPTTPVAMDPPAVVPPGPNGLPPLPLRTSTRFVVDANGRRFKLAGVSWYGGESAMLTPDGLDVAPLASIAARVRALGFNSVRLPWCNEMVARNPVISPALLSANPELVGKTALEVFDAVVEALVAQGVVVVLDNHRSRGDWCCDTAHGDGLWYTEEYPETVWLEHWRLMTERYMSQPAVIGMDLRNEPRGQLAPGVPAECVDCDNPSAACVCEWSRWGSNTGTDRDWAAAAERAGNEILAINPNLLIMVEGPDWAGWVGASFRPIVLSVPNRLVYSVHKYSFDYSGDCAEWTTDTQNAAGYVLTPGMPYTAPLWLGEFGIGHDNTGNAWWACLREFMASTDVDWSYWALNGTQGPGYGRTDGAVEGYGVLDATWTQPANATHIGQLQALQAARVPAE